MFALNNVFDWFLTIDPPSEEVRLIRDKLKTDIVNELRGRGFVDSRLVVQWRRMIAFKDKESDFNAACSERDVEEVPILSIFSFYLSRYLSNKMVETYPLLFRYYRFYLRYTRFPL